MKFKFDIKEYIKGVKKSQEKCLELLGAGDFSVADLEKMIEELKKENERSMANCLTTTKIKVKSCGGSINKLEVPTITQTKSYQDNQFLIDVLTEKVKIAKVNNLEFVTNFDFTVEQILNYAKELNFIS